MNATQCHGKLLSSIGSIGLGDDVLFLRPRLVRLEDGMGVNVSAESTLASVSCCGVFLRPFSSKLEQDVHALDEDGVTSGWARSCWVFAVKNFALLLAHHSVS